MRKAILVFAIFLTTALLSGCSGTFQVLRDWGPTISVQSVGGFSPWSRSIDVTNNTEYPVSVRCSGFLKEVTPLTQSTIRVGRGYADAYAPQSITFTVTVKKPGAYCSFPVTYSYNTWGMSVNALIVYQYDHGFGWHWQ